jgi:hypothetical protein
MLKAASKEHALKSIEKKKKGGKGGKGGKSSASSERDKALRLTRARSFVENVEFAAVMDSGECKSMPLHSDCCALGILLCLLNFVPLPTPPQHRHPHACARRSFAGAAGLMQSNPMFKLTTGQGEGGDTESRKATLAALIASKTVPSLMQWTLVQVRRR